MLPAPIDRASLRWETICVVILLILWVFMLSVNIGTGLIAGLVVFSLTRFVHRSLCRWLAPKVLRVRQPALKWLVSRLPVALTALLVALMAVLLVFGFTYAVRFVLQTLIEQGPKLVEEAIANLGQLTANLPDFVREQVPGKPQDLFKLIRSGLGDSLGYMRNFGGASFFIFLQLVFALILGVSAGLMSSRPNPKPLAAAWLGTMEQYVRCFTLLMGAQVYVSAWNTFCTAVFIFGVLPLLDVVLPFRELLLMFTAVASLIPAAGNIMANTLIVVLTLRHGPFVAMGSVTFLFVIHKVEYFVNGYIIGRNVRASVPEMLIAIILGETAFGLPGLITAPVTYAFLKLHWQRWGWV
ncbi:MAG: AI-2E family transporter [Limnobacter sp.]|nr:AI-2E family transporter [Limnobacter sp.]